MALLKPTMCFDDHLLMHIFELCDETNGRDLSHVVRLLGVCKRWHKLAYPLLFRNLHFSSSSKLHKLCCHVQSQSWKGIETCSHIRRIHYAIHIGAALGHPEVAEMTHILVRTSRVHHLAFEGLLASPVLLTIPLHLYLNTLKSLVVTVDPETIAEAHHIGQLQLLQKLTLKSYGSWEDRRPWDMPNLQLLDWTSYGRRGSNPRCQESVGTLAFLNGCTFVGLRVLRIALRRHRQPPSNETDFLRDFVMRSTAKSSIHTLGIFVVPSQYDRILPELRVAVLDLLDSPLGPSMPPLHPSVKALSITVSSENHEDLWSFLDHLSTHPSSLAEIRVHPEVDFMESFTWSLLSYDHTNVPPAIAEFLGRLLPFAVRLGQRGIRLVDQAGDSLMLTH